MTTTDAPSTAPLPADDRATRRRRLAVLGVLALLAGALTVGTRDEQPPAAVPTGPDAAEVAVLREAADLQPCPVGLGAGLPDLVLPCLSGGPDVALTSAPPGRPTLVNVWASWCGPCVREVPVLDAFAERAGNRVGLVGVLTQDSLRSALSFARASGMRWPSVIDDDGAVMRTWSPGPPVTLFVTADGAVAHVERGEISSTDELAALVDQHLGVRL